MPVTGIYIHGPEVREFAPCGSQTAYWAYTSADIGEHLRRNHSEMATEAYGGVFVRVHAVVGPKADDGFAEDYDATTTLTEVLDVRPRSPGECGAAADTETMDPAPEVPQHRIDRELTICQEAEGWTTQGVQICVGQAIDAWDAELNRVYGDLMDLLGDEEKDVVRSAQRNWIAFRDDELASAGLTYKYEMGTGWGVDLAFHQLGFVQTRVEQLEWMLGAFELLANQRDARG